MMPHPSSPGNLVEQAEDRLLDLRVILTGSTLLHGMLCSHPDRLEAEVQSLADELGEGVVWVEKLKVATKPLLSLAHLAERDELTKVVVKVAREQTGRGELPLEVHEMLETLPGELKRALAERWQGAERASLVDDACAIILERLMEKGAEA